MIPLQNHRALKIKRGRCVQYRLQWGGEDYIGSSINFHSRMDWWLFHFRSNGIELPAVSPILICSTSDREYYEEKLISIYAPQHNKTRSGKAGSAHGHAVSAETKMKIGNANRGKKRTEESKRKMSESAKMRSPISETHRKALSAAATGRVFSKEARDKISSAVKGIPKSEAHKEALRAAWVRRKQKGK